MKTTMTIIALLLTTLPASAQDVPTEQNIEAHPERLKRCGYKHTTTSLGYTFTEAVCVWQDRYGNAFLIAVPVVCDSDCSPTGTPRITAFYE